MAITKKVLGQVNPAAATLTDGYTVPGSTMTTLSTVTVCNRSATPTKFRISVAVAGAADNDKQYFVYDDTIGANESWGITYGVTLAATDVVRVYALLATLSFGIFGAEEPA